MLREGIALGREDHPSPVQLSEAAAHTEPRLAKGDAAPSSSDGSSPVPNEIDGVNTDGRPRLDWKGHYQNDAQHEIRKDALFVALVLLATFITLVLTWRGFTFDVLAFQCGSCSREKFDRYAYFFLGGLLGGTLFGVKYLYKVVARGFWNIDRRLWRLFSPFLSAGLALVVGAFIDSGVLGLTIKVGSGAAYLSYGFITGYFADRAIDKLQEVAETVFGAPGRRDPPKGK